MPAHGELRGEGSKGEPLARGGESIAEDAAAKEERGDGLPRDVPLRHLLANAAAVDVLVADGLWT